MQLVLFYSYFIFKALERSAALMRERKKKLSKQAGNPHFFNVIIFTVTSSSPLMAQKGNVHPGGREPRGGLDQPAWLCGLSPASRVTVW